MKIILADDHPLFREGLKSMLETVPGFRVIRQVDTAADLKNVVSEQQPDLVIMDYRMPGGGALETFQFIKKRFTEIKIILLTGIDVSSLFQQFVELDADGVLIKDASSDDLLASITGVVAGRKVIAPAIEKQLSNSDTQLTSREFQIMEQILQGHNNTVIAKNLSLSIRTVGNHRFNLMQKLGLKNSVELMHYAINNGLIGSEQS
ncbi:MAG: response regulator transcription factor [Pseudomonadota bacterium]